MVYKVLVGANVIEFSGAVLDMGDSTTSAYDKYSKIVDKEEVLETAGKGMLTHLEGLTIYGVSFTADARRLAKMYKINLKESNELKKVR